MTIPADSILPQPQAQGPGHQSTSTVAPPTQQPTDQSGQRAATGSPPRQVPPAGGHAWIWRVVVLMVCAVLVIAVVQLVASRHRKPPAKPPQPIPVVCATVRTGDLPIFLSELGTVTPLATVTVRSRVDGQIERVCFVEGHMVKSGDPLFEIDKRPYLAVETQARGQLVRDRAILDNARTDYKRYQHGGAVFSNQQLVTQKALVEQYTGIIQTDQGTLDQASLQVAYCSIAAPVSGRIGLRLVDTGNIIHAADATGFAVITTLQPITVVFTIREDDIPVVLQHQTGTTQLSVEAYSRDLKRMLDKGTLVALDNQVDQGSGTVRLKALFANADHALFPNQFVNIRLRLETLHHVLLVPTAAVQFSPERTFAYVVGADGIVSVHTLTTAQSEGGFTVISGLDEGMQVVTDGVDKLAAGTKVIVTQATHAHQGVQDSQHAAAASASAQVATPGTPSTAHPASTQ